MENLFEKQADIMEEIKRMFRNIRKDSESRKTGEYRQVRVAKLTELWEEFEENHRDLMLQEDKSHQYFEDNIFDFVLKLKNDTMTLLTFSSPRAEQKTKITFDTAPMTGSPEQGKNDNLQTLREGGIDKLDDKIVELLKTQRSNFRALKRLIDNINLDTLTEKWEIEDEIKTIKKRWITIDTLHLQIDSILEGRDDAYNVEIDMYEKAFRDMKKQLNIKLNFVDHAHQTAPKVDIPIFHGNYSQWPTFMDLFVEAIHKNPNMSKSHKMQILKCKLKGEAERIVQHLHVSAENYDACWELLTHRYNNMQLLFTKQIQIFLRQPVVKVQSAFELKRLYDTSMEVLHAIHNFGVVTTNWDPLLVHLLCEKLDTQTYTDYMEFRNALIHNAFLKPSTSASNQLSAKAPTFKPNFPNKSANYTSGSDDEILLATALLNVEAGDGTYLTLRALIDQGSQITLISENATQRLGLQRKQYSAGVSGVGTISNRSRGKVNLTCKSRYNKFTFKTEALIMSRVVNDLPNMTFEKKKLSYIEHVTLADPDYNISGPIDILLDAEVYSQILMEGLLRSTIEQPIAQQTQLGWILSGNVKTYNCHVITNNIDDIKKYWEIEEITENKNMTSNEQYCEQLYINTTRRLANGQYEVQLPMVADYAEKLGTSQGKALAQFYRLEKKFSTDSDLSDSYKKFMQEYIDMAHMTRSKMTSDIECFLPHHGVVKQDSTTTKLRVVFNASSKTSSGYSLNDLMECGPKLHQDLQAVLIRWRTYQYVFTADCEKMYRMILVAENMLPLQKILWRNDINEPIQQFELCTVTYGTKAAPFLALRTLKQLAEDDAEKYPLAAQTIHKEVYVDDIMSGGHTLDAALEVQKQLIDMLKGACFNLRKWSSNHESLLTHLSQDQINKPMEFKDKESTKTLGLQWVPHIDTFTFKNKTNAINDKMMTKRTLLSEISKIFDPLGWLIPITIKAKLLFQTVWTTVEDWDDILPENIYNEWKQMQNDLNQLETFDIPRWIGNITTQCEIHGFCDASQKAYACAIYLKTLTKNGDIKVTLLVAKSKLAPLKKAVSLPRLELCGSVLLAKLMSKVLQILHDIKTDIDIYAWTDSMIVMGWLKGDPNKWKSFVANRVKEVTDVIPAKCWDYVKSEENAVDCATRGLTPAQLQKHTLWWEGPAWIKNPEARENMTIMTSDVDLNQEAKNKKVNAIQTQPSPIILELLHRYSNLSHVTRIVAWMLRIKQKAKPAYLKTEELTNALHVIIKHVQLHEFAEDISRLKSNQNVNKKSPILSLNPFMDDNNILRLGGRLTRAAISNDKKKPIILSSKGRFTEMLINQAHKAVLHGGPKLTLAYLREKYWIISGYRSVKYQLHRCVTCRRFNPQKNYQLMAELPKPRVTASRPFTHTGVDYTGHVEVKANKGRGIRTFKGYVAVFVCLATKAIHLELVSELDTPSFLAAFKRFCARRGKPLDVYSDQGTNFVGANKVLKQQYKECLQCIDTTFLKEVNELGITWHFNAPAWASAGGLWEAAVKSMKYHLHRVIGSQKYTYEEFTTLLCTIEACLNSRPLCTLTESDTELEILTPGHFLIGGPIHSIAEPETEHIDMRKRWQLVNKASKDFWKTWSNEYLSQLQLRSKWKTSQKNFEVDDI